MEKQKKSFCDAFELLSRFDRKQNLMENKTEKKMGKKRKKISFRNHMDAHGCLNNGCRVPISYIWLSGTVTYIVPEK